mgnify:CR=1 FL=1
MRKTVVLALSAPYWIMPGAAVSDGRNGVRHSVYASKNR